MRVESLVVTLRPSYLFTTPLIPGVPRPSTPPHYTINTPLLAGLPPTPIFTLTTPVMPGAELAAGAGPDHLDETYLPATFNVRHDDHLDETYLPTSQVGPVYPDGDPDLDETIEATTFRLTYGGTDVSAITFPPVRRKSTVQTLTTVLIPGANQTVIFEAVRDV